MKKRLLLALIFAVFVVNGAIAGSGSLIGEWVGDATAILPNGLIIEGIGLVGTVDDVTDGLFSAEFEFTLPGADPVIAYASGYIKSQKIEGTMSVESLESPSGYQGIALFNAKLKGKKMVGVVRDLSDGSTTYFTAKRSN